MTSTKAPDTGTDHTARGSSFAAFFATELRRHRDRCGLSQGELADRIPWSKPTVAAVETTRRIPPPGMGEYLDKVFNLPGDLAKLAAQARKHRVPLGAYVELEPRARQIRQFAADVVPSLLQTADYARAVLARGPQDLERALTERLDRQQALAGEHPARLHAILDESILYRRAGDDRVMRGQLAFLAEPRPGIRVQVLPFTSRQHSGIDGPLIILDFTDEPSVAYADGRAGGVLIDDPDEVERERYAYDLMVAEALSPECSAKMITTVIQERYL